jgi:hypothetical protein
MDDPREEYISLASISREWFEDEVMGREVSDSVWSMALETITEQVNDALDAIITTIAEDIGDGQYE